MTPRAAAGAAGAAAAVTSSGAHHYVGLVRGINVGGNHRITMADFRAVFERLGYTDVKTLLQSGNIVFTAARPLAAADVAAIETAFAAAAGFPASFVVLSASQFRAIVAANPLLTPASEPPANNAAGAAGTSAVAATRAFSGATRHSAATRDAATREAADATRDPSRLVVTFLPPTPSDATPTIELPDASEILPEELALGDHAVYSWHPDGISKSRLPAAFWKQLGPTYTARNVATADRLVALLDARTAAAD